MITAGGGGAAGPVRLPGDEDPAVRLRLRPGQPYLPHNHVPPLRRLHRHPRQRHHRRLVRLPDGEGAEGGPDLPDRDGEDIVWQLIRRTRLGRRLRDHPDAGPAGSCRSPRRMNVPGWRGELELALSAGWLLHQPGRVAAPS